MGCTQIPTLDTNNKGKKGTRDFSIAICRAAPPPPPPQQQQTATKTLQTDTHNNSINATYP